jgi:subtilisin family serine protease
MTIRSVGMSWAAPGERVFCLPRDLLLTMALGEDPPAIPTRADVYVGRAQAAKSIDGGAVDRVLAAMAGDVAIARVHGAAASLGKVGARHCGYSALEQASGLARTFLLRVPEGTPVGDLALQLSQLATVSAASPNYVAATPFDIHPHAAAFVDPQDEAALAPRVLIRAAEALKAEPGDASVMVGLVDSGVAPDHPEISGKLRAGYDTVQMGDGQVATGVKLLGDHAGLDRDPTDRFVGHGMGCSGIIGALGLHMPAGLAGLAQIIPLRALAAARMPGKENAIGLGSIADRGAAGKRAGGLGAKIINMSFGTDDSALSPASPKPHADVIRYAIDHGCVLVAASGNSGHETRYWPAAFAGVIAVGACDAGKRPAVFSTRGEHVALCAPGERVLSCGLAGYQAVTGTSFAAPFVAAAAALLVARGERRSFPMDGAVVRDVLMRSAQRFAGGDISGCGAGILDAAAAITALDALIDQSVPDDPDQIEDG